MNSSTSTTEASENLFLLVFISLFVSSGVCIYACSGNQISNISIRVNQKNIRSSSKEYVTRAALNFDNWKTFSENYEPIRAWLWLIKKLAENYCHLGLFIKSSQT